MLFIKLNHTSRALLVCALSRGCDHRAIFLPIAMKNGEGQKGFGSEGIEESVGFCVLLELHHEDVLEPKDGADL